MRIKYALLLALALPLGAKDDKPAISELDREKLKRIDVQLQLLNKQINETIAPILAEQNEIKARVCAANKIELGECEINVSTGTVTRVKKQPEKK